MKKIILLMVSTCALFASDNAERVFTDIYTNKGWGENEEGKGYSGSGSTLSNTTDYIRFLQDFIRENNIKTVVDAGCGDWTFSKEIDWEGVQYLGVDVVKSVIEEAEMKYSAENIRFKYVDILRYELPSADLLICKDVLMHLTNRDILFFLKSTSRFKHCLFTNDISGDNLNRDIERGNFRPLDLTKAPFKLNGIKIFTYPTDHAIKQVIYHGN